MIGRAGGGFLLILALTIGSSVAPAPWIAWTGDVADVVRAPIMPISRVGVSVASWLRPPRDVTGRPLAEVEIDRLRKDRDRFEQLWQAQRVRADDLARRLRQLENLPESALRSPHSPLVVEADVTGRGPADPRSPIELRMPRDGGTRLEVGDIAVWNGHRILGRLSHVSPLRLMVLPISNPESGPIEVVPASAQGDRLPRMLLRQEGQGMLVADVDRRLNLEPGTRLLLADHRWPAWAFGMEVAVVEASHRLDDAPLRQRVVARPAVDGPAVARVVVLSAEEGQTR